MREYFKETLKNLYVICGIDQITKLTDDQIKLLLDGLVEECNRPEWSKIPQDVQKRVISDFIKTDKDFYGLNVKTVRRALNKFWEVNGQRILEQESKTEFKPIERTLEELARIDAIAKDYLKELANVQLPQAPKLTEKEIQEEGQVEPKRNYYIPDAVRIKEHRERIRHFRELTVRERHPEMSEDEIQTYLNNFE